MGGPTVEIVRCSIDKHFSCGAGGCRDAWPVQGRQAQCSTRVPSLQKSAVKPVSKSAQNAQPCTLRPATLPPFSQMSSKSDPSLQRPEGPQNVAEVWPRWYPEWLVSSEVPRLRADDPEAISRIKRQLPVVLTDAPLCENIIGKWNFDYLGGSMSSFPVHVHVAHA